MDGFVLKVTPDELKNRSDEMGRCIDDAETAFGQLNEVVARTVSYWIGEAGDHHRKMFQQEKEKIEGSLKKLKEHPADLLNIAGIYETTETQAVQNVASLRGNVIS